MGLFRRFGDMVDTFATNQRKATQAKGMRSIYDYDLGLSELFGGGPTKNTGSAPWVEESSIGKVFNRPGQTGTSTPPGGTDQSKNDPSATKLPTTSIASSAAASPSQAAPSSSPTTRIAETPQQALDSSIAYTEAQKREAQRQRQEFETRERSAINAEFEPIFTSLDSRIGMLPAQQKEMEDQLNQLASTEYASVDAATAANKGELDATRVTEDQRSKKSLRELAEDVSNLIQANAVKLGAMGAGDSSAALMGSELITRQGTRERGNRIAQRDQIFAQIDQKKTAVDAMGRQQKLQIDNWKNNQIMSIKQQYQERRAELEDSKTNASVQQARAINELIRGLHTDTMNRLRQLDDRQSQYKQAIDTWQIQRAAALEDFKKQAQISASYSSPGVKENKLNILSKEGNPTVAVDPLTGAIIQDYREPNEEKGKGLMNWLLGDDGIPFSGA